LRERLVGAHGGPRMISKASTTPPKTRERHDRREEKAEREPRPEAQARGSVLGASASVVAEAEAGDPTARSSATGRLGRALGGDQIDTRHRGRSGRGRLVRSRLRPLPGGGASSPDVRRIGVLVSAQPRARSRLGRHRLSGLASSA
jgi:hypothetical protein